VDRTKDKSAYPGKLASLPRPSAMMFDYRESRRDSAVMVDMFIGGVKESWKVGF
jgi:hypothetical protein